MITVLASPCVQALLPTSVEVFDEPRGQISFNVSSRQFETLRNKVREQGWNPFSVMYWQEL